MVVRATKEKGIDLSTARPKMLTMQMIEEADLVVTMGCSVEEVCPAPMIAKMRKKFLDWNLDDPRDMAIEKVRQIRNLIDQKVIDLVRSLKHLQ